MTGREARGTALVEFTWLAILLLVPLVYIVLSVFEVQRGAYAVSTASRSAARAFSLAPSEAEGQARARAAVRSALDDQGLAGQRFDLEFSCHPGGACLQPGSTVTVYLRTSVNLPLLPDSLGGNRPSFRLDSTQQVPYGTYLEPPDAP
jgi:Flp pilus assembly protein TadG